MLRQIKLLCLGLLFADLAIAHRWDDRDDDDDDGDGRGGGRKGRGKDPNPTLDKHVFEVMCLHPGIEQGMTEGDDLTYVNDITSMDDHHVTLQFATFFHVVRVEVCSDGN